MQVSAAGAALPAAVTQFYTLLLFPALLRYSWRLLLSQEFLAALPLFQIHLFPYLLRASLRLPNPPPQASGREGALASG